MKRILNAIIIHCSAATNGSKQTVYDIDAGHKTRGFKRDRQDVRSFNPDLPHIGYHFFISTDGAIHSGRGIEEIGAHVQGSNEHSIGICMSGLNKFTDVQWNGLHDCMIFLTKKISGRPIFTATSCITTLYDLGISVKGHRDYSPDLNGDGIIQRTEWIKDCPNFDVKDWVRGGMVEMEGATL